MTRYQMLVAAAAVVVLLAGGAGLVNVATSQQKDDDLLIRDRIAVNCAKIKAREYLLQDNPGQAVTVLEAQLARIDGNTQYLMLLREAYRRQINKLYLNNQTSEAQKYVRRLRIIDPQLADELTVQRPGAVTKTVVAEPARRPVLPATLPPQKAEIPPATAVLATSAPLKSPPIPSKQEATFRAKLDDPPPDPFALSNALEPNRLNVCARTAHDLILRAEDQFRSGRYLEAHQLYNQAYQSDHKIVDSVKDRWAYTKLYYVVEELKKPGNSPAALARLETEVSTALMLHPRLGANGSQVLAQIADRRKQAGLGQGASVLEVSIKHHPGTSQGWQVAETGHFVIYHQQQRDLAVQVAQVAERTRAAMFDRWFGSTAQPWRRKCEIYLHPTAAHYAEATGVPAFRPGHSRIETDKTTGSVHTLRIELHADSKDMLTAVLPHETTHCVLAGQFGCPTVPRWVDEGIAVLSEPKDKIDLHRQHLARLAQSQPLFSVQELMELPDYPAGNRIGAFYGQSVTLVDYLVSLHGPKVFTAFVRDGVRNGYQTALQRHYGIQRFGDLQAAWQRTTLPNPASGGYAQR
jgi:hypothetical protein